MIELIYGTSNPAKLKNMRKMIKELPLSIIGLGDLSVNLWEPEESGNEPLINAAIKARGYYEQIRRPVFSCDSGLYLDEVTEKDQPGVHIRRIHGQNLKDEDFVEYYSKLASKYGGRLTAQYRNSICLIMDEKTIYKYDGEDIGSEKFYIVENIHQTFKKGFPLDSISVHIESGSYYYDLNHGKYGREFQPKGFGDFFMRSLKL